MPTKTKDTRTGTRGTPRVAFRCAPELWKQAQKTAAGKGETVTDVLIRALREYVSTR